MDLFPRAGRASEKHREPGGESFPSFEEFSGRKKPKAPDGEKQLRLYGRFLDGPEPWLGA